MLSNDRYVIFTTTELFTFVPERLFTDKINEMIKKGFIPLGGCVHYGRSGLMQTMYKPWAEPEEEQ